VTGTVGVWTPLVSGPGTGIAPWSTGSLLEVTYMHREGSPGAGSISFTPVNETHVQFTRDSGASNDVEVQLQEVRLAEESNAVVTRWRGSYNTVPAARPGAGAGDLSLLIATLDQDGTVWGDNDQPLIEFTPTTISVEEGSFAQDFTLQWLQFPGASGTEFLFSDNQGSGSHGVSSFPISVGANIDWSRSVARYTSWNNLRTDPREWMFYISQFNSQGITLRRQRSNNGNTRLAGQIIQFDDGTAVQHVEADVQDDETSRSVSLDSSVPADKTLVLTHNVIGRSAHSRQDAEDDIWTSFFTAELTGCSTVGGVEMCDDVTFTRAGSHTGSASFYATVQVVTFPTVTSAPTPSPTAVPTQSPTKQPTPAPTVQPTESPTPNPTVSPTPNPTPQPTPTPGPTPTPIPGATRAPTTSPTPVPAVVPPGESTGSESTGSESTGSTPAASTGVGGDGTSTAAGTSTAGSQGTVDVSDSTANVVDEEDGDGGDGNMVTLIVALVVALLLCVLLAVFVARKRKGNSAATAAAASDRAVPVGPVGPNSARPAVASQPQGEYGSVAALRDEYSTPGTMSSYGTVGVTESSGTYSTVDDAKAGHITYGSLPNVQPTSPPAKKVEPITYGTLPNMQ